MDKSQRIRYVLVLALTGLWGYGCETASTSDSGLSDSLEMSELFSDFNTGEQALPEENSTLAYTGTYTGVLPCADCAGIQTEIQLTDSAYIKRTIYLGEDQPDLYEVRGGTQWDDATQTLTLSGIAPPNRYRVERNTLTQLDIQGEKITGRLADRYVLQKE